MGLRRVFSVRVWLGAVVACLVLLAASGAWLTVRYRPQMIRGGAVHDPHRFVAVAFYVCMGGLVVALLLRSGRFARGTAMSVALAVLLPVAALVARRSGSDLPWQFLALRVVRVNSNYAGVWRAAFDVTVRFVLAGREVPQPDYRVSLVAHLFGAPVLLATILALCRRRFLLGSRVGEHPADQHRHVAEQQEDGPASE